MKGRLSVAAVWCVILAALDRWSKAWAVSALSGSADGVALLPGVLGLRLARNDGAAFGMLSGMRWLNIALTFLLLILAGGFIWRRRRRKGMLLFGGMLMAGGISHLYDRLISGTVIDFIEIRLFRFAIFNIADICICVGAAGMAALYLFDDARRTEARK